MIKEVDLLTQQQTSKQAGAKRAIERQKSLILRTKEVEIARLKLETLNIYASIFIKLLLLAFMVAVYFNWDTVSLLWSAATDV